MDTVQSITNQERLSNLGFADYQISNLLNTDLPEDMTREDMIDFIEDTYSSLCGILAMAEGTEADKVVSILIEIAKEESSVKIH